jgi:hypothetical protein
VQEDYCEEPSSSCQLPSSLFAPQLMCAGDDDDDDDEHDAIAQKQSGSGEWRFSAILCAA